MSRLGNPCDISPHLTASIWAARFESQYFGHYNAPQRIVVPEIADMQSVDNQLETGKGGQE